MIDHGTPLIVPAQNASISFARRFVRSHLMPSIDPEQADDIVLVTSELVSNAVEHGSGGEIQVRVAHGDDGAHELVVSSEALDLPHIADAPAAADALRGRGLQIVARVSDAVGIEAAGGVVSVTCRFDARPTA